jgi:hypothetical protein
MLIWRDKLNNMKYWSLNAKMKLFNSNRDFKKRKKILIKRHCKVKNMSLKLFHLKSKLKNIKKTKLKINQFKMKT